MDIINNLNYLAAATVDLVGDKENNLVGSVTGIISVIVAVLGIVAVVVMVIGGITVMTSTGDPGKVKKGKDTILYGLMGLIICALAFVIVNWVIGGLLGGGGDGGGDDGGGGNPPTSQTPGMTKKECTDQGGTWKNGNCYLEQ